MSGKPIVSLIHRDDVPESPANHTDKSQKIVDEMVRQAVDGIGGIKSLIKPGERVVIKPNLVWPITPDMAITTDPRVIESVVRLIKTETEAAEVVVAERTAIGRHTKDSFELTGARAAAERAGADRVVCLEDDERVLVEIPNSKSLLNGVHLPKTLLNADKLIYLPKMKAHKMAVVSLTMKMNQGVQIWSEMISCHRNDLEQKMVDMLKVMRPDLSIVDAIWAQEGQGPGSPYQRDVMKDRNLILAGTDPVAVDAVGAATMGIDPMLEVAMIRGAFTEGLGEGRLEEIQVVGARIDDVKRFFRRGTCSMVGVHPKVDVYTGGACVGCLGFARTGLDPILADPNFSWDRIEKISIIIGYKTNVPEGLVHDPPRSYVYVIGDCTAEHKDKGVFLPGCASLALHEMVDWWGKDDKGIHEVYWKYQPKEGQMIP
ncbi:MAG: DUF362 domain-containing protein [Planctomycetota bacterium]|nr:DUF362 domain-containing protein [Planctomycetota bacterium]